MAKCWAEYFLLGQKPSTQAQAQAQTQAQAQAQAGRTAAAARTWGAFSPFELFNLS